MIKHLTSHGHSLALIIEKPILDLLRIKRNTPLKIETDGRNLIISPASDSKREKNIKRVLAKINEMHGKTLKALAS